MRRMYSPRCAAGPFERNIACAYGGEGRRALEVGSSGERLLAGAGQDRDTDVVAIANSTRCARSAVQGLDVERVQRLWRSSVMTRNCSWISRRTGMAPLKRSGDRLRPPHTYSVWPVMYDAAGLAKNSTATPMSSGVPIRCIGTDCLSRVCTSGVNAEQWRLDDARRDRVDRHAVARELDRQAAREADYPALGRRVVRLTEAAEPRARRDVDDAPVAALDHAGQRRAATQELRAQVGGDDQVPVLVRHLEEALVAHGAGVVDQEIDVARRCRSRSRRRCSLRRIGQVDGLGDGR